MKRLVLVILAVALISGALLGCARPRTPTRLAGSEVREYRGKKLDSIDDMRENSIKGPQKVDKQTYRLKIRGAVKKPLSLTYDEVIDRRTYEKVVRLDCVEGWGVDILWKGVLLEDLLKEAGYDRRAKVVIFRSADGYSTSLPLDFIRRRKILFAYEMNGVPLPEERGFPFQVIAEDKWGYKWAKWVTSIEVSRNENFHGYWERRGYENQADVPK